MIVVVLFPSFYLYYCARRSLSLFSLLLWLCMLLFLLVLLLARLPIVFVYCYREDESWCVRRICAWELAVRPVQVGGGCMFNARTSR